MNILENYAILLFSSLFFIKTLILYVRKKSFIRRPISDRETGQDSRVNMLNKWYVEPYYEPKQVLLRYKFIIIYIYICNQITETFMSHIISFEFFFLFNVSVLPIRFPHLLLTDFSRSKRKRTSQLISLYSTCFFPFICKLLMKSLCATVLTGYVSIKQCYKYFS
jgi:hypothetical protein